jgi:hypothetical protein
MIKLKPMQCKTSTAKKEAFDLDENRFRRFNLKK